MTYFVVNNLIAGEMEYFVPDEETKLANDHLVCTVGGIESAEAKANQNKQQFLANESYRFLIAKEEVNGNDTTWLNADLANDPEIGTYQVFNHKNGQYEVCSTLSSAVNRLNELKSEFESGYYFGVKELDKLPVKNVMYGKNNGIIPVEVM